jgi:hypothetical protein
VKGASLLSENWKIEINNPKAVFNELLQRYNEKANLTFTDFCDYIISERLKQQPNQESHDLC